MCHPMVQWGGGQAPMSLGEVSFPALQATVPAVTHRHLTQRNDKSAVIFSLSTLERKFKPLPRSFKN